VVALSLFPTNHGGKPVDYAEQHWQYRLLATVFHGPKFGHYMELAVAINGRRGVRTIGLGQWKGLGIPEPVLRQASGLLVATWEEHLTTRYGIAGELPLKWGGEPDPF
jgi:hypothetical protein